MQQPSKLQNEDYFKEQKFAIKVCTEAIDCYNNVFQSHMVKTCTNWEYVGCGKSWCIQYCLLHYYANGLIIIPTSVMSWRSVFFGSKHTAYLFCMLFEKNGSPYQIGEQLFTNSMQQYGQMNLLQILGILLIYEIGQLSAKRFSTLEMILRGIHNNNISITHFCPIYNGWCVCKLSTLIYMAENVKRGSKKTKILST